MNLERAFSLIRQLQGALGGKRILSGSVTSTGAAASSGFTASRTGVGVYPIVFDVPFATQPDLRFGSNNGSALAFYWATGSANGFTAHVVDLTGAHVDAFWNFEAVG